MEATKIIMYIIVILVFVLFFIWQIIKRGLRQTVIDLIVYAEQHLKGNEEKFNTVVNAVIVRLPIPFNFIITTETVERLVQKIFDEIKVALDYKKEE